MRVAVRKGTAPAVGSFVAFKAHLAPPLAPLRPGGYDFARDMYFQRSAPPALCLADRQATPAPQAPGLWLRYAALLDAMREGINTRIHALLPGDRGSIASALITGKRNAISDPVNDAFYVSSLAHVLAISGYHMAVVAGIVFFFIRAGLALIPSLASRRPIKKWAAAAALVTAAFYLVLSGASVSTQRAFIMIAIVLIGVMLDRPALTFRTIAMAAFAVLLLTPEAIVHPSFQMSFAAALALIAAYQYGLPWSAKADTSAGARMALWGGREIAGVVLASLVAGLATTPYSAFHFHRLAPYGVLANLLAMPVISAWVMPMGILGVVTMPFGFDALFWKLMGDGVDWMIAVVLWVAHLPGAVGHIHAFGTGPLLLATAGLLLLCLLRSPLRWSGAVLALAASLWVMALPRPDVLVAGDGQAAAVRGHDGRLAILHSSRDTFAIKEWLMADGDGRDAKDASLHDGRAMRRHRLHRTPGRRPAGVVCAVGGSLRRGLRARRRGGVAARGAGRLPRRADRPQGLARQRRHGAALGGRSFRGKRRAPARAALDRRATQRDRCATGGAAMRRQDRDMEAGDQADPFVRAQAGIQGGYAEDWQ